MKLKGIKFGLVMGVAVLSLACSGIRVRGSGTTMSENREVGAFDSIELESFGDVFIEQGDEPGVVVEADVELIEYVNTDVRNGTLYLRVGDRGQNVSVTNADLRFFVTVSDLEKLSIPGSGDMFVEDVRVDDLTVEINGSGDVTMQDVKNGSSLFMEIDGSGEISIRKAEFDEIESRIRGSGDISIGGKADEQSIQVGGSGDYIGGDLESQSVEIAIQGSGNVDVWAEEALKIDISGSGNVRYFGEPRDLAQQIDGSGDVRALGEK